MKNILEICQDTASLAATQKPENLFNGSSQHEAVFLSVARDTLDGLLRFGDWQELTKEGVLRTVRGRTVYPIDGFCPDFFCLQNNTVYVKDAAEKVVGSLTPQEWMREKYFNIPVLGLKFKIQNGMFKFLTLPPPNMQIVFQYRSSNVVYDPESGYAEKSEITKNTDIPVFDEYLVKKGILWRWNRRNGLPYEEEFNEYQREVKNKFGAGLASRDINLSGAADAVLQGVVVNAAKSR